MLDFTEKVPSTDNPLTKFISMNVPGKIRSLWRLTVVKPGSHLSKESGIATSGRCDLVYAISLQKRSNIRSILWLMRHSFTCV